MCFFSIFTTWRKINQPNYFDTNMFQNGFLLSNPSPWQGFCFQGSCEIPDKSRGQVPTKATSPDLTEPRYMLIEAAEGGCLEDAPWDQHRFFPLTVLCCGVWDRTSTWKKGILTWNLTFWTQRLKVCKMICLFKRNDLRFHVNFLEGCIIT